MSREISVSAPEAPPSHPDEMRGGVSLRIGDRIVMEAGGRVTPAGVIATGLALAAIAVAFGFLMRSTQGFPPRRRF
ncbi:MAG: hypothetical protein DI527_08145 [Chelatococcus sp.]|nr:MAG: hypothetical protein DI527_08145 [Chelatococcus sp.]